MIMAPKKRLGKDPFENTAATPVTDQPATPKGDVIVKAARPKKAATSQKSEAAVPAKPGDEMPDIRLEIAKIKQALEEQDKKIQTLITEVQEHRSLITELKNDIENTKPRNERFFNPWRLWFPFFPNL